VAAASSARARASCQRRDGNRGVGGGLCIVMGTSPRDGREIVDCLRRFGWAEVVRSAGRIDWFQSRSRAEHRATVAWGVRDQMMCGIGGQLSDRSCGEVKSDGPFRFRRWVLEYCQARALARVYTIPDDRCRCDGRAASLACLLVLPQSGSTVGNHS
jgi:hypothetical protein